MMWMVLPHHKADWQRLPDEAGLAEAIRKQKAAPGMYGIPHCHDAKQMKDPAFIKKLEEGPVGMLVLRPSGPPRMGGAMFQSFLYNLAVAFVVAYVTGRTLGAGAHYLQVFRVAGTVTTLAYAGALFYPSIWMGKPWAVTVRDAIDGFVYGMLTAGVFGWLWPR
jgi:hypothetical protein